ncbi:MAG: PAS-domain containing protein, partial [Alphaproteobacteria bacterium]
GNLNLIECNRAFGIAVDAASPADAIAGQKEIASGPTGWGRKLAERARDSLEPQNDSLHVVVGGSRKLLEITELPLPDSDLIAGFCLDRTAREQAEDEMTRHLAAHGEVLERLGTAIIIFGPDSRVQFFNSTYAKLWELDEDWLRSGPTQGEILEELRAHRRLPEQVDFQAYKKSRAELYTTLIEPLEELLHLPDERVMRMVVNPHPFGGLLYTFEDVTDRLTLERSYNTLIAVQQESLNNLHEAVAVFGSDGRLKLFNPAYQRIWNFTPEALEGEPRVTEVIESAKGLFDYGDDWEDFKERAVGRATDHMPHAGRFGRTDGTVLDYASIPLPDGAVLFSYLDVTDSIKIERALRERNEALETADRLKSEFIANVSYELRTPLNSIIGFTEILLNQYFGTLNERQLDHAQSVVESSQVLLALIDDILDLAMIEAGRLALDLQPVDVYDMMSNVLNYGHTRAVKQNVALKLKCPKKIGEIVADGQRLRQALFNLVSNSLEHTPEKGTITMSASRDGDDIIFAVADTGRGIAQELQARVFDKFEHGRRGVAHTPGVGLGLSLVKSFIELHGGTVELASKSGKGTTITCRLPAVAHQQTAIHASGKP